MTSLVARLKRVHYVRGHGPNFRDAVIKHSKDDDEQERYLFRLGLVMILSCGEE